MFLNQVTLIGFTGGDVELQRTRTDIVYSVLSIATKASWKDKTTGEWTSRTEWHRCVAYRRLAEFVASIPKGAHVQVQGELRSREYTPQSNGTESAAPRRAWEIRLDSVLKLDRTARRDESDHEEVPQ